MPDIAVARRRLLSLAAGALACATEVRAATLHGRPQRPAPHRHLVAIDPGHGGIDPGTIGVSGIYEKQITLATALELAHELESTGRFTVLLTRHADRFVPLRERVARARARHAELFLSIHADAFPETAMHGLSVYTLSDRASDREAAGLAARENKGEVVDGLDLAREPREIGQVLFDLARRQTMNRSLAFAQDVIAELRRSVVLLEKPRRAAGFAVLTAPDIPSVLVETGALSNPAEDRLLRQPAYRRRIAQGLAHAIERYFAAYGGA